MDKKFATSKNLLYTIEEAAAQIDQSKRQIKAALGTGELVLSGDDLPKKELITGRSLLRMEKRIDAADAAARKVEQRKKDHDRITSEARVFQKRTNRVLADHRNARAVDAAARRSRGSLKAHGKQQS